jgi:putative colanic acid biosynthesis acetyltransferase WcaF
MNGLELTADKAGFRGATFTLSNRLRRVVWLLVWTVLARWTPPPLHRWRIFLLNIFGARVASSAYVYASVSIWAPWNLEIKSFGTLGPKVRCYNIAPISVGRRAVVSQNSFLCTGTHNYADPAFPLTARPISIADRAWVCADAFVGPGVTIREGAVLAAAAVAFEDLNAWTVYVGNPAVVKRSRPVITEEVKA